MMAAVSPVSVILAARDVKVIPNSSKNCCKASAQTMGEASESGTSTTSKRCGKLQRPMKTAKRIFSANTDGRVPSEKSPSNDCPTPANLGASKIGRLSAEGGEFFCSTRDLYSLRDEPRVQGHNLQIQNDTAVDQEIAHVPCFSAAPTKFPCL